MTSDDYEKRVVETVRRVAIERGVTQKQLAQVLDMSHSNFRNIIGGRQRLRYGDAVRLMRHLGLEPERVHG